MYLRALSIRNFRGIREAALDFDATTVLIGENDCGRSSILEALTLLLGSSREGLEQSIKPHHFHRPGGVVSGPILIAIHLAETRTGDWMPPARIAAAWKPNTRRIAWIEFRADPPAAPGAPPALDWWLRTSLSGPPLYRRDAELLAWVRGLSPVAWIRGGFASQPKDVVSSHGSELMRKVGRHFQRVMTGDTPDIAGEIEAATAVAREFIASRPDRLGGVSLVGVMASEILGRSAATREAGLSTALPVQKLGVLLLMGALSQVGGIETGPDSRPVLLVENPESNLHPMTVAAVWQMLQRLNFQKVITTHSGNLLSNCPLGAIRRLTRTGGVVRQHRVLVRRFSREDLRRVSYHVRSRRASAMFARCWLLVEGESEFWIMPELARILGSDFAEEGIACVEFAQCGVKPLIKLAEQLGIGWHVLTDGDEAGERYEESAVQHGGPSRVTRLSERDIEHCFWKNGYQAVIQGIAYPRGLPPQGSPRRQIERAIERTSKPFLALSLVEGVANAGRDCVPRALREAIEKCVSLARGEQQIEQDFSR
jgi:putative ATP-dependent endonuclease of the OLD family